MTIKLNDLQSLLLSTASNRKSGCLVPLPKKMTADPDRLDAVISSLLRRKLVEKAGEQVIITEAGRRAISLDGPAAPAEATRDSADLEEQSLAATTRRTKSALVIGLISRPEGAGADELISATGWLAHTVRAALTGLRKKGLAVDRVKENGASRYRLSA